MKTILLLHDEARRPTHLLQNAVRARAPIGEIEDCRRAAIATAGVIRVQAVSSVSLNRQRSFRFQCRRRNEVKHGIPNCI